MLELERLGVRVVSGRLGRGKDEEDGDDVSDEGDKKNTLDNGLGVGNNNLLGGNNNMVSACLKTLSLVLLGHCDRLTYGLRCLFLQ